MGLFSKIGSLFKKKDEYFEAYIMMLRGPRFIEPEHVKLALAGEPMSVDESLSGPGLVTVTGPSVHFGILSVPEPYDPIFRRNPPRDLRLREAATAHEAFISVFAGSSTPPEKREATRLALARTVSRFYDEDVLLIWETDPGHLFIPSDESMKLLSEGRLQEAVTLFDWGPVVSEDGREECIEAAMETARQRFPEFVQAFQEADDKEQCIVKMRFENGDFIEYIWIQPTKVSLDSVEGTLLNRPINQPGLTKGTLVSKPASELSDWLVATGDEPLGGFTLPHTGG